MGLLWNLWDEWLYHAVYASTIFFITALKDMVLYTCIAHSHLRGDASATSWNPRLGSDGLGRRNSPTSAISC